MEVRWAEAEMYLCVRACVCRQYVHTMLCTQVYDETRVEHGTRYGISWSAVIGHAISWQIVPNTEMRIFRVFRGGTAGNQGHPAVRGKRSINQSIRGGRT